MIRLAGKAISMLLAAVVLGCGGSDAASGECRTADPSANWIGAWATAPSSARGELGDQSLRMIVHPTFGGERVRVRFTQRLGTEPVTLASASIGRQAEGAAVVPGSLRRLRFGCQPSAVLEPGADLWSDPVSLSFSAFENLAISFHLEGGAVGPTRHDNAFQTSYLASEEHGDRSTDPSDAAFSQQTTSWFLLGGLEVIAPDGASAIVAVGDSITDGEVSDGRLFSTDPAVIGQNLRYPDFLARRLAEDGRFSVLNLGIGGNRLLSGPLPGFPEQGPALLSRLEADVLAQPGVEDVIVLIGTNDLGLPLPTVGAAEVIDGLEQLVDRLRAAGLNVLLGTQTPAAGPSILGFGNGSPRAIEARNRINDWARSESRADAVVDFHAALRDPTNPDAMALPFDSGDELHPSPAGYAAMAEAVDLEALRGAARP